MLESRNWYVCVLLRLLTAGTFPFAGAAQFDQQRQLHFWTLCHEARWKNNCRDGFGG